MKVTIARCYGCGGCLAVCSKDAITLNDEKAVIDLEKCIQCKLCEKVCPLGLIKIDELKDEGQL